MPMHLGFKLIWKLEMHFLSVIKVFVLRKYEEMMGVKFCQSMSLDSNSFCKLLSYSQWNKFGQSVLVEWNIL
jgi:hypothetical protein